MSELREFSIGKKRKADFALRDEEDREAPKKQPESFMASEEELKKRRIVKVIRGGSTMENPNENVPKGKFSFLNSNANESTSQEIKNTDSHKKIHATTATIRFNKPPQQSESQIIKSINSNANTHSDRKTENADEDRGTQEGNIVESGSKKQETTAVEKSHITVENKQPIYYTGNVEKKFNFGGESSIATNYLSKNADIPQQNFGFSSQTSAINTNLITTNPFAKVDIFTNPSINVSIPQQKVLPFSNVSQISGFNANLINTNPFAKADTHTNNTFINPFAPAVNNILPITNKFSSIPQSGFNFNIANAAKNPNWNSDEEDGDDQYENPEEEIGISGKSESCSKPIDSNPNLVKFFKINVDDLSEYNFEAKKYQSKGKGDISLELTRTDKDTVVAMCAYRNNALKVLFQGNLIANVTNLNVNTKNYKHIIVIQKLFSVNQSTNKPEAKSVRLEFHSENDFNLFREKFGTVLEILHTNDLTIFPKREELVVSQNEKCLTPEEENKQEEKILSDSKKESSHDNI